MDIMNTVHSKNNDNNELPGTVRLSLEYIRIVCTIIIRLNDPYI